MEFQTVCCIQGQVNENFSDEVVPNFLGIKNYSIHADEFLD